MEEGVLRTFETSEILNIIHNEYIYRLIEIQEIGYAISVARVLELQLKGIGRYIEYTRAGIRQQGLRLEDESCLCRSNRR